jgi:hypothetical protein
MPILGVDNKRSMHNNSKSDPTVPPSMVKENEVVNTGTVETERAMKNLSISKEEKEVITAMDWPTLGGKTTPKSNDILKSTPAINHGVWGSTNTISVAASAAWNNKNTKR